MIWKDDPFKRIHMRQNMNTNQLIQIKHKLGGLYSQSSSLEAVYKTKQLKHADYENGNQQRVQIK